jgi:hypothetical protein
MVLENISGPKREEAARDWRKQQSEDDQIKETSGACGRYGGKEEKSIHSSGGRNMKERNHLKTQMPMGDIIKMDLEINEMGREEWIHMPQGWNKWRALVNSVIKLRIT